MTGLLSLVQGVFVRNRFLCQHVIEMGEENAVFGRGVVDFVFRSWRLVSFCGLLDSSGKTDEDFCGGEAVKACFVEW